MMAETCACVCSCCALSYAKGRTRSWNTGFSIQNRASSRTTTAVVGLHDLLPGGHQPAQLLPVECPLWVPGLDMLLPRRRLDLGRFALLDVHDSVLLGALHQDLLIAAVHRPKGPLELWDLQLMREDRPGAERTASLVPGRDAASVLIPWRPIRRHTVHHFD